MKIIIIIFLLFLIINKQYGQNLILNPSFEVFAKDKYGNLYAQDWLVPNTSTIDYYSIISNTKFYSIPNNFLGFHPAYEGSAYIGFVLFNWSGEMEHYTGTLKEPLKKDSDYQISFYIRYAGDSVWIYSKSIELLFTKESKISLWDTRYQIVYTNGNLLTSNIKIDIEQAYITKDWVKCNAKYKAKGGETIITFGLFYQGDNFIKLINEYSKDYFKSFEKQVKFINSHEEYPIFTNKHFKPTIQKRDFVFAYYFLDAVSVTPFKKGDPEEDYTYP